MAFIAWQATVQDDNGNAVVNPTITVRRYEDNSLAPIYIDAEGSEQLPNPFTGGSNGFVQFFADYGRYLVVGAYGASTTAYWDVLIDDLTGRAETAALAAEDAQAAAEAAQAASEQVLSEVEAVTATVGRYETTAAGLADTVEGDTFWVYDGEYLALYRHDAGPVATDLDNRLPLAPVVEAAVASVDQIEQETRPAVGKWRDAPRGFVDAIRDVAKRAAFGVTKDGHAVVGGDLQFRPRTTRDGMKYQGAVRDASGKAVSWYDRDSGEFTVAAGVVDMAAQSHRDASRFAWALKDDEGKVAFGAGNEGQLIAETLEFSRAEQVRDTNIRPGGVRDRAGRFASWYDRITGAFASAAGFIDATRGIFRSASPYVWDVRDRDGKAAIGVNPDGTIDIVPSAATIARIGGDGYLPVSDFALYDVATVRAVDVDTLAAVIQEPDGIVQGVRQNSGYTVAVAENRNPIKFFPFYGQSNAGNVGVADAVITTGLYPHNCLTFFGLLEGFRDTPSNPDAYIGIEPARDKADEPPFPATMTAFAYEAQSREDTGRPTPGVFTFTSWWGGQPLTSFIRGTVPWDNLMIGASKAVDVAALYARDVECDGITYIQGEHGPFTGYKAALIDLAADVTGELQSQMGLATTPEFFVVQTNEFDDAVSSDTVFQDQFEAARDTAGITMIGPMYHCPLDDSIHLSPIGRMVLGDTLAAAMREFRDNGSFTPTWPVSSVLAGSTVTVTFSRPVAIDSDWVLTVANAGFVIRDDSGVTAITNVSVSGNDVVLTLASPPAGANPRVEYAVYTGTSAEDGWGNGRGLIYSPTTIPSYYYTLGYDVPEFVRHYSVRFTANL